MALYYCPYCKEDSKVKKTYFAKYAEEMRTTYYCLNKNCKSHRITVRHKKEHENIMQKLCEENAPIQLEFDFC